ncbi:MAG: C40 family peptidase [Bacteroidaceae bacterium]
MKKVCNTIKQTHLTRGDKSKAFGLLFVALLLLVSCKSSHSVQKAYMTQLAKASITLGIDIDKHDDHALFLESAHWIGVPYRYGGNNEAGIDCSGLSSVIYNKVYHTPIPRTSSKQYTQSHHKSKKHKKLKQGSLLFFTSPKANSNTCSHVGIFLKDDKFIHASSSRGVMISRLSETYWQQNWLGSGYFGTSF